MNLENVIVHGGVVGIVEKVISDKNGNYCIYRYFSERENRHLTRICFAWDDHKIVG